MLKAAKPSGRAFLDYPVDICSIMISYLKLIIRVGAAETKNHLMSCHTVVTLSFYTND